MKSSITLGFLKNYFKHIKLTIHNVQNISINFTAKVARYLKRIQLCVVEQTLFLLILAN